MAEHGELDILQLRDYINTALKHGTTTSELGNVLNNNHMFRKIRMEKRVANGGRNAGSYDISVWGLN